MADREAELKALERMRAKGELTEGEYLGRKHKLMNAPEGTSTESKPMIQPALDAKGLKRGGKGKLVVIVIVVLAVAAWWFLGR